MVNESDILKRLGQQLGEALGEGPSEARQEVQKEDLLSINRNPPAAVGRRRIFYAAAAVVLSTIAGVVALNWPSNRLSYSVVDDTSFGDEGSWVQSTRAQTIPIRFEGGSQIEVGPASSVRVVEATLRQVKVELGGGQIKAHINGNEKTRWSVQAGPYQVSVMGTVFSLSFDPATDSLDVAVEEGLVLVTGARLSERGIRLARGDLLTIEDDRPVIARKHNDGDHPQATDAVPLTGDAGADLPGAEVALPLTTERPECKNCAESETDAQPRQKVDGSPKRPRARSKARAESIEASPAKEKLPSWLVHYDQKDYQRAIDQAKALGLPERLQSLDLEVLWKLASAARYCGQGEMAHKTLVVIRTKHSGSGRAQAATFLLGRVSLELLGLPLQAIDWFRTYLVEHPAGPLAEESLGRLISALTKADRPEEAAREARRYLDRYPDGPFVNLAQSAINR